jgi:proteic killer suppression protein
MCSAFASIGTSARLGLLPVSESANFNRSRQAYKRLENLEAAADKRALMMLPSNRFAALVGDRAGQYSIRINDRWRICFEWPDGQPEPSKIEIVDYL